MQSNPFILDADVGRDEITAKATQLESSTAGPEPGVRMPGLKPAPPPPWTNY